MNRKALNLNIDLEGLDDFSTSLYKGSKSCRNVEIVKLPFGFVPRLKPKTDKSVMSPILLYGKRIESISEEDVRYFLILIIAEQAQKLRIYLQ